MSVVVVAAAVAVADDDILPYRYQYHFL